MGWQRRRMAKRQRDSGSLHDKSLRTKTLTARQALERQYHVTPTVLGKVKYAHVLLGSVRQTGEQVAIKVYSRQTQGGRCLHPHPAETRIEGPKAAPASVHREAPSRL